MANLDITEKELEERFKDLLTRFLNKKTAKEYFRGTATLIEEGRFEPLSSEEVENVVEGMDELSVINEKVSLLFGHDVKKCEIKARESLDELETDFLERVNSGILRCGYTTSVVFPDGVSMQRDFNNLMDFKYIVSPYLLTIITCSNEADESLLHGWIMRHQHCVLLDGSYIDLTIITKDIMKEDCIMEYDYETEIYKLHNWKENTFLTLCNFLKKCCMKIDIIRIEKDIIIFKIKTYFNNYEVQINRRRFEKYY